MRFSNALLALLLALMLLSSCHAAMAADQPIAPPGLVPPEPVDTITICPGAVDVGRPGAPCWGYVPVVMR